MFVRTLLSRLHLYERLKGSGLYDFYWRIVDDRVIRSRNEEVSFYADLLQGFQKGDVIFDIGANHGTKTDVFLRLGARVVAVDPDPINQAILRQRFIAWRLSRRPVVIVGKAVSENDSVRTMWIDSPGSAKNTLSQKWVDTLRNDQERFGHRLEFARETRVDTVTLEQLAEEHGRPFFIKIDVEGFEPQVLRGLEQPIPYLSFEVNLPEFLAEGQKCVARLKQLSARGQFNYAVDCRVGLQLSPWANAEHFHELLSNCREKSIEVFWKA